MTRNRFNPEFGTDYGSAKVPAPPPRQDVRNRATPVFDKARTSSNDGAVRIGLSSPSATLFGTFRQSIRDREAGPPSRVLTAQLMGDPQPGRVVPETPETPGSGNPPRPRINLRFRDLEQSEDA